MAPRVNGRRLRRGSADLGRVVCLAGRGGPVLLLATLLLSVMGAFTEFEHALMLERQREGIAAAKACRVDTGRKPTLSDEQGHQLRERAVALLANENPVLAAEFGIRRETVYSYLRAEAVTS